MDKKEIWLSSKEAKIKLHLRDCELMHLRVSGKIKFKKSGNAYYYQVESNSQND